MMADNKRQLSVGFISFYNTYPIMYAESFRIIEV